MRTALYSRHIALGAKIVDFSGWEMPLQYQGIIQEHHLVRQKVGMFDVSHMGRAIISGPDAAKLLDKLCVSHMTGRNDGTATYTVWCSETGGCLDDLIIYQIQANEFFAVFNAGNRQKDLQHLQHHARGYDVVIKDRFQEDGILAIQGPLAIGVVARQFPEVQTLKQMHVIALPGMFISRTGYTGAGGVEIYAANEMIVHLWDLFMNEGQQDGIQPIGLGARDTLRLEMGYALYGHELSEAIAPTESVAAWTVKEDKADFLGKSALRQLRLSLKKRMQYGVILKDKGIAREGYEVYQHGIFIGKVTSGTFSPSLNQAIAIVLVNHPLEIGEEVEVKIRQNFCKAAVTRLPFYKER